MLTPLFLIFEHDELTKFERLCFEVSIISICFVLSGNRMIRVSNEWLSLVPFSSIETISNFEIDDDESSLVKYRY